MDLFDALKQWGFVPVTAEEPTGDVEYIVTIHKRQSVMYETLTNRDALNSAGQTVARLQRGLKTAGYYTGDIDGVIDGGYSRTVYALQRYLGDCEYYAGRFDGKLDDFSSATISALQDMLHVSQTGHVTDELVMALDEYVW